MVGARGRGPGGARHVSPLARVLSGVIGIYRRVISPLLPRSCRYEPTCSAYALQALREFGILRGLVLATWRVLRCNPFSDGGYDPVEDQRLFSPVSRAR